MELLGQAANIFKLISMIEEGVRTVRRNEEACRQLSDRASMIKDRLRHLQKLSKSFEHLEMWKPIQGLKRILRRAHKLIVACQRSSYAYKFCVGSDLADQLQSVQKEMNAWNKHLSDIILDIVLSGITVVLLPNLHGNRNTIKEEGAQVPAAGSSDSHLNNNDRGKPSGDLGQFQFQLLTEPDIFTEGQLPDTVEELSIENQMSRCCCWCPNISYKKTGLTKFSFSQLNHATNYFSLENEIGFGGSSSVYMGQLNMGLEVAVQRASYEGKIPFKHFENEIEIIPKLHHINKVKLLGYCIQKREKILVFEYMPNGSLDSFIYGARAMEALEWPKRRQIVEGIAQGAMYLHKLCDPRIVHGDLKPGNTLGL